MLSIPPPPAASRTWTLTARAALCGLFVAGLLDASATQGRAEDDATPSLPGMVISTTPPSRMTVPSQREPQAKPPSKAHSKSKSKPVRRREANADHSSPKSSAGSEQGIVVLVNDEPITAYQVRQRAAFLAVSGGGKGITERARANLQKIAQAESTNQRMRAILEETIKANPGKTRDQVIAAFEVRKKAYVQTLQRQAIDSARASMLPTFKDDALEELIDERLKLQEAKRLNIGIGDDVGDKLFKEIAGRNKMTEEQFAAHLKRQGIDPMSMKMRLKAQSAWRDVIRRKFGHLVSVTGKEIDKYVGSSETADDETELQLQLITLSVPGKVDQKRMAQRLEEAEVLRRKFTGCKGMASLAKGADGASYQDLGFKKAGTVSEPTRSLLLNAKDGQMVPANLAQSGVELYAVCGRRTIKVDEEKRLQAQNELAQKEFDVLARRHLRDLRQDALIEKR